MIMAAVMIPLIAEGLTFGPDHDIRPYNPDTRDQKRHDIATYGFGDTAEVYIVYEDYFTGFSNPHVYFQKSNDGGENWQAPVDFLPGDLEPGDKQQNPAMDIYDDGSTRTIAVGFLDSTYREISGLIEWVIVVRFSTDGGVTWSADSIVTPVSSVDYPSDKIKDIAIAFDPYGTLFVTWTNLAPANDMIDIAYSTDFGTTWSTPQNVKAFSSPQSTNWQEKYSTVAADGQYVFVAFQSDPEWRQESWWTKADASNLNGLPPLTFDEPKRVTTYPIPFDYQTWNPKLEADTNGVHMVWWDFSTDVGGANNYPDIDKDRPSIKYTKSTDHGSTWSASGQPNLIVNKSQAADKWHSEPDIALGPDGTLAVTWMDYTLGHTNIFATNSYDGGNTWSKPARVNDHAPSYYKEDPIAAVDSGGDVQILWAEKESDTADIDLVHARSIINQAPEPIDDLVEIVADERYFRVAWTPNYEPDFLRYKTYVAKEPGFSISDTTWPDGPLYNVSTKQLMNQEIFTRSIDPDTDYYVKVGIEDQDGLISLSNEVNIKTRPVNKPPQWERDIPTLYLLEDESQEGILNLTYWKDQGWITDDAYNGYSDLQFEIESLNPEPNVTARVRKIGLDTPYWYVDIFTSKQNWFGEERFRIIAQDAGKDGGFGTNDDKYGPSNVFTVRVNSTNDLPFWARYQDLNNGWQAIIEPHATELVLLKKDIGCIEGQPYVFAITANDIDGDFLEFESSDPRVDVERDTIDPQHKSIFTFTPNNDDVPEMNMTITASDKKGGLKNITVFIPVENVNNAPYFISVEGEDVKPSDDRVDFEIFEKGTLIFNVSAGDIDYGDVLTLRSGSRKPVITKVSASNWTVRVNADEQDTLDRYIVFTLELLDLVKTDLSWLTVNITVINLQDPVEWIPGREKVTIDYKGDETDENEWSYHTQGKFGGSKIQAEWGEVVDFKAFARDPDNDEINYTWVISSENGVVNYTLYGKDLSVRFYPSNGNLSRLQSEKYILNVNITDGKAGTGFISTVVQLWVWSDDDNDNDGMPDIREKHFWGDLSAEPNDDDDLDGYTNIQEIGFSVPQYDSEKKTPYSIPMNEINPLDPEVYIGHPKPVAPPEEEDEETGIYSVMPPWLFFGLIALVVVILIIVTGIGVVLRLAKKKEEQEDEELERKVKEMERRQEELSGLYGVQKAGEVVGPDQSTLDDLKLDLGGQIYHEEGSKALVKKRTDDVMAGHVKEEPTGPQWEATGGPLFEETAPGLDFGESLEIDSMEIDPEVTEIGHDDVDEEALEDSMSSILDAAEEYDEEAVRNAGGNVLVGAVPMEDQIKQMQGQKSPQGPRVPPPGQEPPEMQQVPPGQAPPQIRPPVPQAGLPPAKPAVKRPPTEDE
jgi:hypothetical protein